MQNFRLTVAICGLLIALIVSTETSKAAQVAVGDARIAFAPPQGYCELDRREPLDAGFMDAMGKAMGAGIHVLSAFADCTQLSIWRRGLLSHLDDYGFFTTTADAETRTFRAPRAAVIRAVTRQLSDLDLHAEADAVRRRSAGATTARLGDTRPLGVLHTDADAVYYGMVAQVTTAEGRAREALQIGATTLIKGKLVSYLLYGEFRGPPSVETLLARQRTNMDRLIAAN